MAEFGEDVRPATQGQAEGTKASEEEYQDPILPWGPPLGHPYLGHQREFSETDCGPSLLEIVAPECDLN